MNTSKDNLEFQIKKQIEEREIAPSRDLWAEIEPHNAMNVRSKSKINWFFVAACLILVFSLGTVLFFFNESSETQQQMVQETIQSNEKQKQGLDSVQPDIPLVAQDNATKEVKEVPSGHGKEEISALTVNGQKLILKNEVFDKKPEPIQISTPKMMAKADSAKIPAKKKKYVDPSTLLFSVEHKDVIEKTKDGSNVATIELNTK